MVKRVTNHLYKHYNRSDVARKINGFPLGQKHTTGFTSSRYVCLDEIPRRDALRRDVLNLTFVGKHQRHTTLSKPIGLLILSFDISFRAVYLVNSF